MKRLVVLLVAGIVLACLFVVGGCDVAPGVVQAGVDPVSFMVALTALAAQAKELGGTPEWLSEQIGAIWDADKPKPPPHPLLDAWGRITLKNGRLIFCPIPLIEKWEGLTFQQIENIRGSCAVDALGRWKWTDDDGTLHYVASGFSGFYSSESPPTEFLVSAFWPDRWDAETLPDGTIGMVRKGLFKERTYKTHFTSLEDAEAYPWP